MSFVISVYENMYIIAHYIVMCAIRRFFFLQNICTREIKFVPLQRFGNN